MKTNKIQFNAKSFKATRDTMSAYFEARYNLAVELDKTRKATKNIAESIRTDEIQLIALKMGEDSTPDGTKIVRTREVIENALKANRVSYNAMVKPYNDLATACEKALTNGVALFNNKDSVLYKAYCAYVLEPTDDNYNAYAKAMADRFVELGLTDATADNMAHYMVNADRFRNGTSACKAGKIVDALTPKAFAEALLRKFHDNNADAFNNSKFKKYCDSIKTKANAK